MEQPTLSELNTIVKVLQRIVEGMEKRIEDLEETALTRDESRWTQRRAELDPLYGEPVLDRNEAGGVP